MHLRTLFSLVIRPSDRVGYWRPLPGAINILSISVVIPGSIDDQLGRSPIRIEYTYCECATRLPNISCYSHKLR